MSAHALLGPSSAKRWMECPPSARLSEFYEDHDSVYALEGTDAHTYAELRLLNDYAGMKEFRDTSEYYNAEMEQSVGIFTIEVLRRFKQAQEDSPGAILLPEQYLRFDEYVPEGFGTGDVTILSDDMIEIIDLKYGKGVPVYADNNPQTKLYGLGAWLMYGLLYDIKTIRMTIIQPRLESVTSEDISLEKLLYWADIIIRPAGIKAWYGLGETKAGKHCQFCKAKIDCSTYAALPKELKGYGPRENTLEDAINDFK